jgi:hypothetical protein
MRFGDVEFARQSLRRHTHTTVFRIAWRTQLLQDPEFCICLLKVPCKNLSAKYKDQQNRMTIAPYELQNF